MANTASIQNRVQNAVNGGERSTMEGSNSAYITNVLSKYEAQIAQALPRTAQDLTSTRIIQIAATIVSRNEDLKKCDIRTVVAAVMQAAIMGLNPLPQMAECYLIPYKKECQFQIGYRGWLNIYHRNPLVQDVEARAVKEGDDFSFEYGGNKFLRHIPKAAADASVTHAYCIVRYVTGGWAFVVLNRSEIDALRRRGEYGGKEGFAWRNDFAAMAVAKAMKQVRHQVPSDGASIEEAAYADGHVLHPENFRPAGGGVDLAALPIEEVELHVQVDNDRDNKTADSVADAIERSETMSTAGAKSNELPLGTKPKTPHPSTE